MNDSKLSQKKIVIIVAIIIIVIVVGVIIFILNKDNKENEINAVNNQIYNNANSDEAPDIMEPDFQNPGNTSELETGTE